MRQLKSSRRVGYLCLFLLQLLSPYEGRALDTSSDEGPLVEVELSQILPTDITGIYYLVPYRHRRGNWGQTVSLGLSSFRPTNYEPRFISADFRDVYSTSMPSLMEVQVSLKKNWRWGSIGFELGAGLYDKQSISESVSSKLRVIPVRLGLNYNMDNLYFEPYIVPYMGFGAYTMIYSEKMDSVSFGGNTQVAPYWSLGLSFQLNWIDREAAKISYLDSGIENTFIYVEGRHFMASRQISDPNFSTGFDWGAGIRLEF